MKRAEFSRRVKADIDSAIAELGLNPKDAKLRESVLDDLFQVFQRRLNTMAVFNAQRMLLQAERRELAKRFTSSRSPK
jgi:hypothetical protein